MFLIHKNTTQVFSSTLCTYKIINENDEYIKHLVFKRQLMYTIYQ